MARECLHSQLACVRLTCRCLCRSQRSAGSVYTLQGSSRGHLVSQKRLAHYLVHVVSRVVSQKLHCLICLQSTSKEVLGGMRFGCHA